MGRDEPRFRYPSAGFPASHFSLLDVGADGEDFDAVDVVEVVFDVEFVEVERRDERGVIGGREGCAQEREGEVGSVKRGDGLVLW